MFIPFLKEFTEQFREDIAQALQQDGDAAREVVEKARLHFQTKMGIDMTNDINNNMFMEFLDREIAHRVESLEKAKKESEDVSEPSKPSNIVIIQVPDSRLTRKDAKRNRIAQLKWENESLQRRAYWLRRTRGVHPVNKTKTRAAVANHKRKIMCIRVPDKALTNPLAITQRHIERNQARISKLEDDLETCA